MSAPGDQADKDVERTRAQSRFVLIVALIFLIAFAGVVWYMISQIDADEVRWARLGWLFGSVEAIAFAAAGAIFGSSVQRDRAINAERKAEANQDAASKGAVLARRVKTAETRANNRTEVLARGDDESAEPAGDRVELAELATLAHTLFPD